MKSAGLQGEKSLDNNDNTILPFTEHQNMPATGLSPSHVLPPILLTLQGVSFFTHFSVHGIFQARVLAWLPFPSPGDLPDPGIKPRSPALPADSLLTEPIWRSTENPVG